MIKMTRRHFYLPTPLLKELHKRAKKEGLNLSEFVRRILQASLNQ